MNSIQFNLLPDVKLEYLKAQRRRGRVISICVLISIIAAGIFLFMLLTVNIVQKKQLSDANKSINEAKAKLSSIKNLDQVVTVQNQLQTLVGLHQNKHLSSRIFSYLPAITPTSVNISGISLDFGAGTMSIEGTADSQKTVNTFIDTLKFTTYTIGDSSSKSAFPSVVESSFSIGQSSVGYTLNVHFDPILFNNNTLDSAGHVQTPALKVPSLTTTRSVVNAPSNLLFNGQPNGSGAKP